MKSVKILKTYVNVLSIDELHSHISRLIQSKRKSVIDYLNIYSANIAFEEEWFKKFLDSCSVVLCDGKGVQLGAFLSGQEIPPQIAYNRWLWNFFLFCQNSNYSIFLLGSKKEVLDASIKEIKSRGYDLNIDGHHGYFQKEGLENDSVIELINSHKPNILLVGFGMPVQEKWVLDNFDRLDADVIILGGAFLDWISGSVSLPPKIVSSFGLEWLYRLIIEPRRLAHRYLVGIPKFFYRLFTYRLS